MAKRTRPRRAMPSFSTRRGAVVSTVFGDSDSRSAILGAGAPLARSLQHLTLRVESRRETIVRSPRRPPRSPHRHQRADVALPGMHGRDRLDDILRRERLTT